MCATFLHENMIFWHSVLPVGDRGQLLMSQGGNSLLPGISEQACWYVLFEEDLCGYPM